MARKGVRFLLDVFDHRLYLPSHGWACLRCGAPRGRTPSHGSLEEHLRAAVEWIRRAHRAVKEEGVAARYTFRDGWLAPYPETTGYIIPTLLEYSRFTGDFLYQDMAFKLARWLVQHQLEEGAFPGGHLDQGRGPVVFNTGQILIGLLAAYRQSKEDEYLKAACRAGQWLVETLDEDGAWRRFTYKDRFHAYHTRVAWPLVDLGLLMGEKAWVDAGRANLDFALSLQKENGWFQHNTLDEEEVPFTHTLAYTARGLMEAGVLLGEEKYTASAEKLSFSLLMDFETRGYLAGQYDEALQPVEWFSCLTGNAQMAIIWQKLAAQGHLEADRFVKAARKIIRQVMHCQDIDSNHSGIRGGIPGSWPISGPYIRYGFPNWAAKFLADALLFELKNSVQAQSSRVRISTSSPM